MGWSVSFPKTNALPMSLKQKDTNTAQWQKALLATLTKDMTLDLHPSQLGVGKQTVASPSSTPHEGGCSANPTTKTGSFLSMDRDQNLRISSPECHNLRISGPDSQNSQNLRTSQSQNLPVGRKFGDSEILRLCQNIRFSESQGPEGWRGEGWKAPNMAFFPFSAAIYIKKLFFISL